HQVASLVKGQVLKHGEPGGRIPESQGRMTDGMGAIEARKISFDRIEALSKHFVSGRRGCTDRQGPLELCPLMDELDGLVFRGSCAMTLEFPAGDHAATGIQPHPTQIRLDHDDLLARVSLIRGRRLMGPFLRLSRGDGTICCGRGWSNLGSTG